MRHVETWMDIYGAMRGERNSLLDTSEEKYRREKKEKENEKESTREGKRGGEEGDGKAKGTDRDCRKLYMEEINTKLFIVVHRCPSISNSRSIYYVYLM